MSRKLQFLPALLALLLCLTGIALGQETAGEIQGTTKDPQGAVVPGVTITITGVNVGFNRTLTSDESGYYRARQVPPGIYTVKATPASGFTAQTKENVQVVLGQATTLDFDLAVAQVAGGNVTVTSDETGITVDPTDTKVQENITTREIEALPKGTGFSSLLRTTTAVRAEPLSGQFQINGGSGAENSFIVDGQSVENFRTGALNTNNDIPFQSVQEIQVKSSGFEAEFGGATGGVVNVVTKSGTNDFHGDMGLQFATPKFNAGPRPVLQNILTTTGARGQFVELTPQSRDRGTSEFPTIDVGGPVIKDRLWFYAIHSPRYFHTIRTTRFIANPDVGFVPTVNATNPVTGPLNAIQDSRETDIYNYSQLKLDASPSNALRLSSSFTWNPIVQRGVVFGNNTLYATPGYGVFGGTVLAGEALANRQGGRQNSNNFRVEGVYTPNNKLVTLLRYSRGFLNEKLNSYFIPNETRFRCRQVSGISALGLNAAQAAAAAGCVQGFQSNTNNSQIIKDVSIRNQVNADISYLASNLMGRHEFKGGYEFNRILNDVNRGYRETGRVSLYYGRTTWPAEFTGVTPPFPVPAGVAGVGTALRFGTQGTASNRNQALYIQDKWQPTERLTFNLGLRTEKEDLPAFNGQNTNLKFSFKDKLAPRIGVAYDLTGDGKTRLSAFYGWFYDRLKFELPRGSFGGDFYRIDYFIIPASGSLNYTSFTPGRIVGNFGDPIGGACPAGGIASTGLTKCQLDYRVPSNLPNLVFSSDAPLQPGAVDPNLKPFRQAEFTAEFQRELMTGTVFKGRYLYRNVLDAVEDAGFLTPTGSEFYIIANPGSGLHAQRARELGFERLATPQRRYDAMQVEVDSRFIKDFNFNVNYTYSRLFGNYSGLASSDENGRLSPGVNRFFDQPFVGFTASGQKDNGRLATDRPHVFKASGTYSYNWFNKNRNATDLTFFTTLQSGTPLTTFVSVFGILIPETRRGDLGRTEMFSQTDFNLTHRYRFGTDARWSIAFDFNVLNAFNQNHILAIDNTKSGAFHDLPWQDVAATYPAAVNILTSKGVTSQLAASFLDENNATGTDIQSTRNYSFGLPSTRQAPRAVRFGFRFMF